MPETPRKAEDKEMSPDQVAEVVTENMSPFKTPSKTPADQADGKERRNSFMQSFTSD